MKTIIINNQEYKYEAAGECKLLGRCYLDMPDSITDLIMLIVSVKAYGRMQEGET